MGVWDQDKLRCPSCGAPLVIRNRFVRMITCDFCENISLVTDDGLDPTGRQAALHEQSRLLFLDALGEIEGRAFRVVGRLRYQTDTVYWDEWLLVFDDGEPGWLAEDEGTYKLYYKEAVDENAPPFHAVGVGMELELDGGSAFVTEIGEAMVSGGEGQLAFPVVPGQRVDYVDAVAGDQIVSLEYHGDHVEMSVGRELAQAEITVQDDYMAGFESYV